jgi:hypothetical protein
MRAAAAVALAIAAGNACGASSASWDVPGANPFTGSRWHAIMRYHHIPTLDRLSLGLQVLFFAPLDIAYVTKTALKSPGSVEFTTDIRGMYFGPGRGKPADLVTRAGWPESHVEPAWVWCSREWCVLEPWVCGNISWALRAGGVPAQPPAARERKAPQPVPEPSPLALLGAAMAAFGLLRWRG